MTLSLVQPYFITRLSAVEQVASFITCNNDTYCAENSLTIKFTHWFYPQIIPVILMRNFKQHNQLNEVHSQEGM